MVEMVRRCVLRASLYHHPRYVRRRGCWQFGLDLTSWEWASAGNPKFWDKGGNKHMVREIDNMLIYQAKDVMIQT